MATTPGEGTGGSSSGGSSSACHHELLNGRHVWSRRLGEAEAPSDPWAPELKVHVHDGRLLIRVKDRQIENLQLPPTAFTGDARTSFHAPSRTLRVEMAAKDPAAPAMVEKAAMDPDRPHPREVPLTVTGVTAAGGGGKGGGGGVAATGVPLKEDPTGHGKPTPAQAEYGTRRDELFGRPHLNAVMPSATMASNPATDMPVLTNPGSAVETVDNGETVVVDPKSSDTTMYMPEVDQLAERMGRAEIAPAGTTVVRGSRDKVVEREYGQYGSTDAEARGDQYARKTVDFTEEKVGMATRPLEARDFYATCESGTEPYSSVKAQNETDGVACDLCQCAPCQCDKMAKGYPYELTAPELKRSGKPSLHSTRKPVTGVNSHPARDFRLHAKPRSEQDTGAAARTREYTHEEPNKKGVGSLEELPPHVQHQVENKIVGGREIDPELLHDRTRTAEAARHFLG